MIMSVAPPTDQPAVWPVLLLITLGAIGLVSAYVELKRKRDHNQQAATRAMPIEQLVARCYPAQWAGFSGGGGGGMVGMPYQAPGGPRVMLASPYVTDKPGELDL